MREGIRGKAEMRDTQRTGLRGVAHTGRPDRTSGKADDTATTMRLRVLDLEGELWPEDQGRADDEAGSGTDPEEDVPGNDC